jgi:hypothetical protein
MTAMLSAACILWVGVHRDLQRLRGRRDVAGDPWSRVVRYPVKRREARVQKSVSGVSRFYRRTGVAKRRLPSTLRSSSASHSQ